MRCDIFYKTCTKKATPKEICLLIDVEEDASLEEIVAAASDESGIAFAARADKGIYEIQTDRGIFSRGGKALVRRDGSAYADVLFRTWEDMEGDTLESHPVELGDDREDHFFVSDLREC